VRVSPAICNEVAVSKPDRGERTPEGELRVWGLRRGAKKKLATKKGGSGFDERIAVG